MKNEKETINYSEDAEVLYFADKSIEVENYDTEVAFENTQKFQATVCVDEKGNVSIIPFGLGENYRNTAELLLASNAFAKVKKSPSGSHTKLIVSLPTGLDLNKNFLFYAQDVLSQYRIYKENHKQK